MSLGPSDSPPSDAGGAASGETGRTPVSRRCGGGAGTAAYSSDVVVRPVPWKFGRREECSEGRLETGGPRWDAERRRLAGAPVLLGTAVPLALLLGAVEGVLGVGWGCFPDRDLLREREAVPFVEAFEACAWRSDIVCGS